MSHSDKVIDWMSRAARPSLFDAIAQPDLLISLILANLMSPALWDLAERTQKRVKDRQTAPPDLLEAELMSEIQSYMSGHLYHVAPLEMPDLWGVVDLQGERDRLGADLVDYTIGSIVRNLEYRRSIGTLKDNQDIAGMIAGGQLPEYDYSNIDVIRAHRRHLQRKKHVPLGITSCCEETLLIASLATVLKSVSFMDITIIGSPIHYTTFLQKDGQAFWFNGKQVCFDPQSWEKMIAGSPGMTVQAAFDGWADIDRVVRPSGTFLFREKHATMPKAMLNETLRQITGFFGEELQQLKAVPMEMVTYAEGRLGAISLAEIDRLEDAGSMVRYLKKLAADNPETVLEAAFYCFRDISVRHPEAYLAAALRGHRSKKLAEQCQSVDDVFAIVRGIDGDQSIFNDYNRLSMPDEVILFKTGTDRDKVFLLFTLILLAGGISQSLRQDCEIVFTEGGSYVRVGADWFGGDNWEMVPPPSMPSVLNLKSCR